MTSIANWASPVSSTTRLVFLADRVVRVLGDPAHLSPEHRIVLSEARSLVSSALEGSELITNEKYSVAAGQNFTDLRWTASALNAMATAKHVARSSGVADFLSKLSDALTLISEGNEADEEWVDTSRQFFRALRNVVLDSWSRPLDHVSIHR